MPPFKAITRAGQVASGDQSPERAAAGRRYGRCPQLLTDARMASQTLTPGLVHTRHGVELSAQDPRWGAVRSSATHRTAVPALKILARARGRSLELDLVWSDRGRSGQEAVVCGHVSTDPSLRPGCHELRWEREGRRTLDETETLDERRKRLPGTPRGCIRKPRAARSIRPCVRRESGLWHERGCDT